MTNPHTTNFDFPTVYEYKRLCIDHPVRNQKIPRLDRHSVPYARQNGRTPVSDRNRDYRIHRRGNRPRRIGASGEKDSETQTRRILRIDVQIRRISEADGHHSATDGFRPAAIRFQQRFRLVHPEREDHLDLFFIALIISVNAILNTVGDELKRTSN